MYTIKKLTYKLLKQKSVFLPKYLLYGLPTSAILMVAARLAPLLKGPWFAYSYDFGFYLYQIRHLGGFPLLSYLAGVSGTYASPLFLLYKLTPLNPENFLLILALICEIALIASFFRYFKSQPKLGLLATLLCIFSIAQTEVNLLVLIKTLIALPLMILGLAFVQEQRWRRSGLIFILLLIMHRTTAIFFTLTLLAYGIFIQIRLKQWRRLLAEVAIAAISFWFIWSTLPVSNYLVKIFSEYNPYVRGGIFLAGRDWLGLLWLWWVLGLAGAVLYAKHRQHPLPLILAGITCVWILAKLPFYNRADIYLDLAVIIFIAYLLGQLDFKRRWSYLVLIGCFAILAGYNFYLLNTERPLINYQEVQEIKNFHTAQPGQFVLTTSANDATWLLGFLPDSRLAAPGLFEDRSTYQEWQDFWHGLNQTQFLWRYPRPLYIYQRDYYVPGPIADCFYPLSAHFFEYVCRN